MRKRPIARRKRGVRSLLAELRMKKGGGHAYYVASGKTDIPLVLKKRHAVFPPSTTKSRLLQAQTAVFAGRAKDQRKENPLGEIVLTERERKEQGEVTWKTRHETFGGGGSIGEGCG